MKILDAFKLDFEPHHLRTYDQREVDLLLVRGDASIAFEIKAGERVHASDAKHLRGIEEVTGIENRLGVVVYRGRSVEQLGEKIWAVPDVLLFGAG